MRILHTSDWHLGQTLHDFDRTYEHQCFLDWLLGVLEAERPDALLIAGDVFDNANPAATAQHQLYRFLTAARTRAPGMAIVLIAGNHDSAGRLEAPAPLLSLLDTAAVGQVHRRPDGEIDVERLVVPLGRTGSGAGAWCLAIPFLRPSDVPRVEGAADGYLEGVTELYRRALAAALARRAPGEPIIAMGHCHMANGQVSEHSERRIVVGGAEALPNGIFHADVAYAALGHLHLAQTVGDRSHVRYSGSPLPMSFAEIHYPHQVVCVDFEAERAAEIRPIPVPRSVPLLRVPARHAPLDEALAALVDLSLPDMEGRPPEALPYLEVRVRLDAPEPALRARVEAALADKPVRLARIDTAAPRAAEGSPMAAASLADLERLTPEPVFARLCEQKIGEEAAGRPELIAALQVAFAELAADLVSVPGGTAPAEAAA